MIDHERARRQNSLRGDPLIAPPGSNYPEGTVVDYLCLACGWTFDAHDDDSDCWKILKSKEDLALYENAEAVCRRIKGDGF